ncbi:methyltransferase CmcJ [Hyaloscypha finlandica]|nr:methyltransferase CmcJ [Hyaloscypha finlandica]
MIMADQGLMVTLKFLDWQELYETEKPFQIFINIPDEPEDKRTSNLVFEDVEVAVHDVRGREKDFDLDANGFRFLKHSSILDDFHSKALIEDIYLPEVEALLRKEVEDVDKVFFFDWRLRNTLPEATNGIIDLNDLTNWLRPVMHVHIDQSPHAVLNRIKLQFKDEAQQLLKGRVRIINVWRPLVDAIQDWPLAICDGTTVSPDDLVETDHVRRQYTGSTMYLKHNDSQRFYYMNGQGKDDVLIFKNFDSKRSVKGKFAPHASFQHPNPPKERVPRESIEVRAIVFTYSKKLG